jgi:hypothetical protein
MSDVGDSGVVLIVGVGEAFAVPKASPTPTAKASPLENRFAVGIDRVHNFL